MVLKIKTINISKEKVKQILNKTYQELHTGEVIQSPPENTLNQTLF